MEEEKKDAEYALSMANIAMHEAVRGHDRITKVESDVDKVGTMAGHARNEASTANAQLSGINSLLITYGKQVTDIENSLDMANEEIGDLNLSLAETNRRIELLEIAMRINPTPPIAEATDAEAELAGQLIDTEQKLDAVVDDLTDALKIIYDIRKLARETGEMIQPDWDDVSKRSVAALKKHNLI